MSLLARRPLALLSALALATCWLALYLPTPGTEPSEDLLMSLGMLLLVGLAPLFNLAKGLGRSPVARCWAAAGIVSMPSFAAAGVSVLGAVAPEAGVAGGWFLIQFIAVPVAWAVGASYLERHRPLPNNSSKPTPLRGAA